MLRKIVWIFLVIPVALVLIAFALANRHDVPLILDPFAPGNPALAYDVPLFVLLLGCIILGLIMGGIATWFGQGQWRKTARLRSAEASELRRETERLNQKLEASAQRHLPHSAATE